jgi:6-phosphogluconolactonase
MTMEEILSTDEIIVACCGKSEKYPLGKAEGMQRALEADETKDSFPAAALRDCALWLLDEGAASLLTK